MHIIKYLIWPASLCLPATVGVHAANNNATATITVDTLATDTIVKHNPLTEGPTRLTEVVVTGLTGSEKLKHSPAPVAVIGAKALETQPATNIIDAIAHQPGLSQVTTGSGISKPVIRGLGFNRIVVVNGGIRQEGQQWGEEHGIETDENAVEKVEVLKGPASLTYGSDAMAGVLIFHPSPLLPVGEMRGKVGTEYQTNNGLFGYSFRFAGNKRGLVWNTLYSGKLAHAYKNKRDGYVPGSQFHEQSASQLLGMNRPWGHSLLTLSYYHLTPSIIEGERDEETGVLLPDNHSKTYHKAVPYQQVHHYKAVVDNAFYIGGGKLSVVAGYQQNRRQEYEEAETPNTCGLDFMLHTVNYTAHYLSALTNGWKWTTGVGGMYQQSVNKGTEYLIPAYNLVDFGAFATASKVLARWHFSGGVRYDVRHLNSHALAHRFAAFSRNFQGVTGSVGATFSILPSLSSKLNVARGFRAPNISELGSNGVHEGTARYEVGNAALKPENSWQVDWGLDWDLPFVSAQLSLFANRIDHFIYAGKLADADGNVLVVEDGMPQYQFTQGTARLVGGELAVDVHPTQRLHINNAFSYVNSVQLHRPYAEKYLPLTPAPRWNADIRYEFVCDDGKTIANLFVKATAECNFRQKHYYAANHTETATPFYALFGLQAGTDFRHKGRRIASLYITADNLLNRAYQSHLNRLKYTDVNAVTGRQGVCNMGRNVVMKVVFPLAF